MDEERDGPFTGEMFEAEVARNRPRPDQGSLLVKLRKSLCVRVRVMVTTIMTGISELG
jgi:hypothetical protein